MKTLELSNGTKVKLDDSDFEHVEAWTWHATKTNTGTYVSRHTRRNGVRKNIVLSHFIMGMEDQRCRIGYRNGNVFDLRKKNLIVLQKACG